MTVRLSVVVPAYNEEARVGDLVRSLEESLSSLGDGQEIIVVDDGSSDGTAARVTETGVRLVRHEHNQGKAAAVQTGLAASVGAYVAVLDADLEYFPADLIPMLEQAEAAGTVAVYGSRYLEPRNFRAGGPGRVRVLQDQELSSWVANWVLTGLVVGLYGKVITDTLTGLKLYPGPFLRAQHLTSVGFEGDHEITGKLIKSGIPILEIPIAYAPRGRDEGKKIGPRDGVKAITTFVGQRFTGEKDETTERFRNTAADPALMRLAASASRLFRAVDPARRAATLAGQIADYTTWQIDHFGTDWRLCARREELWRRMSAQLRPTQPVLVIELGVAWGYATAYWLESLVAERTDLEWHGFDRFTGLPVAWRRFPAGAFAADGPPRIDDSRVHWHVGDVEDTLGQLDLSAYADHQKLVLFDLDLYGPTALAWKKLVPVLRPGDLLYFDEALDMDERRVLDEEVLPSGTYDHLGSTSLSLALQVTSLS
jgi:hypothetical protein